MISVELTDKDVVETISEFMGVDGNYLTSYDALAPVWRRVMDNSNDNNRMYWIWKFHMIESENRVFPRRCPMANWLVISPRDHAYAVARTIKEAARKI